MIKLLRKLYYNAIRIKYNTKRLIDDKKRVGIKQRKAILVAFRCLTDF